VKNILMPDAKAFGDLFGAFKPWKYKPGDATPFIQLDTKLVLQCYCMNMAGKSMEVWPLAAVEDVVNQSIVVRDDHLYFELVDQKDGETLVVVKHNRIIGSRYLAVIATESIPKV
jgi:hypothetical protein